MSSNRTVRILVVGDEGVGKTSLITSAATDCFAENPVPVLPPTRLPAELTPELVPVVITDTSSRPEDRTAFELAAQHSDVILLLFATNAPQTLQRVRDYWMPQLRLLGVQVPIVLVGTKMDLKPPDQNLQQVVSPVMQQYKEIETCLECSAKLLIHVGETVYYALKAVLHPTAPLFDLHSNQLKPRCIRALKRIFVMCDKDKDGSLNDEELNDFQINCFSAPLQPEELAGVKAVVSDKMPQGVSANGLTLAGFLFLHALFIERGRLETTWQVLRKFGYDNEVQLSDETLSTVDFTRSPDQVVQLTEVAREFLSATFMQFDHDGDGVLSQLEQDDLFSTAPSNPWAQEPFGDVQVETGPAGGPTLGGFLAKWSYMTAMAPRAALAHLLYLGYEGDARALFAISKPRRQERKPDVSTRSVYQCYVFGSAGAGKTALVEGLVRQPHEPSSSLRTSGPTTAVGLVRASEVSTATLIMREVDGTGVARLLQASPSSSEELAVMDVAAFVFDSSSAESFTEAQALLQRIATAAGDTLSCVFVAAKDDLSMPTGLEKQVAEVCASLQLRMPIAVSVRAGAGGSHYKELVAAAQHPDQHTPLTPSLRAARQYRQLLRRAVLYTVVGVGTAAAAYALWHVYKTRTAAAGEASSAMQHTVPSNSGSSAKANSNPGTASGPLQPASRTAPLK